MNSPRNKRRIALVVAAGCLLSIGAVLTYDFLKPRGPVIPDVAAELGLKPRAVDLIAERAARARDAILKGEYGVAGTIITAELARSTIESWRFYPFRDFINDISDVHDPVYGDHVDAWIKADLTDALPLLVRAQYEYDMAWARRGTNYDRATEKTDLDSFEVHMAQANRDIDAVLSRSTANPYYFALKLRVLYSLGAQEDMEVAFGNAIREYPSYYPLYSIALATLQPKWGGSVRSMKAFVDSYAGPAAATSPLKMLYVELYENLLTVASEYCKEKPLNDDGVKDCIAAGMRGLGASGIEGAVAGALELYRTSDKYQYDVEIASHIAPIIGTAGAGSYAGALLQLAAHAAGSDTQLTEDAANRPNDYMIDYLVGLSWGVQSNYIDSIRKYEEALRDMSAATFPDEEAKDLAYASIFEGLAGDYDKLHQFEKEIAYERAAVAYGGPSDYEHLICTGYIQKQLYQDAVDACTLFVNGPDGVESRYWRAAAYYYLKNPDAEAAVLRIVADSENWLFRTQALIGLSVYYSDRHEFRTVIDLFANHSFTFDEASQRKSDLAIVYNNRCYANMQLGELRKALDDCTASLRFGNLPDAFHKQQELVSRLKAARL